MKLSIVLITILGLFFGFTYWDTLKDAFDLANGSWRKDDDGDSAPSSKGKYRENAYNQDGSKSPDNEDYNIYGNSVSGGNWLKRFFMALSIKSHAAWKKKLGLGPDATNEEMLEAKRAAEASVTAESARRVRFNGDISKYKSLSKLFGFFEVEITAPTNMKHPIIQTKLKMDRAGMRTVAPLGTWTDWLFSEEIINAMKKGYSFKILKGYTFDKAIVFDKYIKDLYKIKSSHSKDDPMYLIAKLLMNSLYGRFGMDFINENTMIMSHNDLYSWVDKLDISEITELDNKIMISYTEKSQVDNMMLDSYSSMNISIGIASAITAYARIHMSQFKNNSEYELYYSDTDSIVINKSLDSSQVGKEIGLMKLENTMNEGVFIAPKVYGGLLGDGSEFTKVKGFKDPVTFSQLKSLLDNEDKSLILDQEKWFRSFSAGEISINKQIYTLKATENKRKLLYNDNQLTSTEPFIINKAKKIVSLD